MTTTISDVAKRAGVSPVTVSRVLNNATNVSETTRIKVQQAIAELGYVPSSVAQSLRSKRTNTIALIVPDIQNPFWTTAARGVEDAAQSQGYSVFLCNTDESRRKQLHYLGVVISQRVDGVIIAPYDTDAENLAPLRRRNIPTVLIDRYVEGWDVDTVVGDSRAGARAIVKHLIDLGHRHIAVITGSAKTSTATERLLGYRIALAEAGLPYDPALVKFGEYRAISGEWLTHQLLNQAQRPTAIFATNNAIAMGVIDALDARGLRVPADIILVCFDDLPGVSRLFPFLTTVVQPAYEIGANAAQLLLSQLQSAEDIPPRHVVLPTRLIIRQSCGASLHEAARTPFSLPLRREIDVRVRHVRPLTEEELQFTNDGLATDAHSFRRERLQPTTYDKSDSERLCKALRFQEADRVPHIEVELLSSQLYTYVLGRQVRKVTSGRGPYNLQVAPQDAVEFAQRLGIDAIACDFSCYPNSLFAITAEGIRQYVDGTVKGWGDLDHLEPAPPLADQLNQLEEHLRAADGSGVGVFVNFTSFFQATLRAVGFDSIPARFHEDRFFMERLLDMLTERQEAFIRAVCDRFASELAFVMISDEIADANGSFLNETRMNDLYVKRMKRMLAPAKAHGKPVAIRTQGDINRLLPLLHETGFDIVHPMAHDLAELATMKQEWNGKLVFMGNFPISTLLSGSHAQIQSQVGSFCQSLGVGGGYIFSTAGALTEAIPPDQFVAMVQALHTCGHIPDQDLS